MLYDPDSGYISKGGLLKVSKPFNIQIFISNFKVPH